MSLLEDVLAEPDRRFAPVDATRAVLDRLAGRTGRVDPPATGLGGVRPTIPS
jgi:hypothetical protein